MELTPKRFYIGFFLKKNYSYDLAPLFMIEYIYQVVKDKKANFKKLQNFVILKLKKAIKDEKKSSILATNHTRKMTKQYKKKSRSVDGNALRAKQQKRSIMAILFAPK